MVNKILTPEDFKKAQRITKENLKIAEKIGFTLESKFKGEFNKSRICYGSSSYELGAFGNSQRGDYVLLEDFNLGGGILIEYLYNFPEKDDETILKKQGNFPKKFWKVSKEIAREYGIHKYFIENSKGKGYVEDNFQTRKSKDLRKRISFRI